MKNSHDIYKDYKNRSFKLKPKDEKAVRGIIIDLLYENYIELEKKYKILQDSNFARDLLIKSQSDMIKILRTELLFYEKQGD